MFVSVCNKSMCRQKKAIPHENRFECHFVKCHSDLYEWDALNRSNKYKEMAFVFGKFTVCQFYMSHMQVLLPCDFKIPNIIYSLKEYAFQPLEFNFHRIFHYFSPKFFFHPHAMGK